jgi:hypothetical protein
MVEAISEYAEGQRLDSLDGLLTCFSIGKHAGYLRNFGQPAAIVLLLDLDGQWHDEASLNTELPGL